MTALWTSLLHVNAFAHVRANHPKWCRTVTFTQSKRAAGRKKSRRRSPARLISSLSHSYSVSALMTKLIKACLLELCPTMWQTVGKAPCYVGLDVKHAAHKARSSSNLKLVRLKDNDGSRQQGWSNPAPYNHTILDAASIHYCLGEMV